MKRAFYHDIDFDGFGLRRKSKQQRANRRLCPPKVFLVGCQPEYVDDAVEGMRPPVERAVPHAIKEVLALIDELLKN